jgi:hypothetical protein
MNIILQHWNGDLPTWAQLAKQSLEKYCESIGCDYELVTGYPLGKEHGPYAQKLIYLNEKYDSYDQTLMLDMDTVATNVYQNVFDVDKIGVLHSRAMKGTSATVEGGKALFKQNEYVFFGNFIKLNLTQRQKLRACLDWSLFEKSVTDFYAGDEIILHYLLHQSGILKLMKPSQVCMRRNDVLVPRQHNRLDRKFCNLPEDSDKDASIIHFCSHRKKDIPNFINNLTHQSK